VSDEEKALYPRWASLARMAERAIESKAVYFVDPQAPIARIEVPAIAAVAWGNKSNQTVRVRSE